MKKLLAFLMTLAMLASLAVLPASAEEERVYTSLYSSEVSTPTLPDQQHHLGRTPPVPTWWIR